MSEGILHAITTGIQLALAVAIPGSAVNLLLSCHLTRESTWGRFRHAIWSMILGICLAALVAMALGLLRLFHIRFLFEGILMLISVIGFGLAIRRPLPLSLRREAGATALLLLLGIAGTTCVMMVPKWSEWIAGGWDPGVYVNEGISLARTGNFAPADAACLNELTPEERRLFTTLSRDREQRLPGLFTGMRTDGHLSFEFFRLFPSVIGILARYGGVTAACRVNLFLGLASMLLAVLMLGSNGSRWRPQSLAVLVLVGCPLWVYHLQIPVSEMLQLCLVLAILAATFESPVGGRNLRLGLLAACAELNRFTFLPLGLLLVAGILIRDCTMDHSPRQAIKGATYAALGLWLSAFLNIRIAPASLDGWDFANTLLIQSAIITLVLGAAAGSCFGKRGQQLLSLVTQKGTQWLIMGSVAMLILSALGLWALPLWKPAMLAAENLDNILRLVSYCGTGMAFAAMTGLVIAFWPSSVQGSAWRFPVLSLLAIIAFLCTRKFIFDLYPWATRRYLPFVIPVMLIGIAEVATRLAGDSRSRWRGILPVTLIGLLVAGHLRPAREASLCREFYGFQALIRTISSHTDNADLVIAEHFWWGMPLLCIHGAAVADGGKLSTGTDSEKRLLGAVLNRLAKDHQIVLILGGDTPAIAEAVGLVCKPLAEATSIMAPSVIHHPRATRCTLRDRSYQVRPYLVVNTADDSG